MRRAAAHEPGKRVPDLGIGRLRLLFQERRRGHDPAVDAVAALRHLLFDVGGLQRMRLFGGAEAPDGGHLASGHGRERHHAGAHRLAVQMHGARAALRESAAEVRIAHPEVVAQRVQERHARVGVDRHRSSVDGEFDACHGASFGCAAGWILACRCRETSVDPGRCLRNAIAALAAVVRYAVDSGEEESRAVKTGARETGIDLERFRLRRFVEELRQAGELEVHAETAELAGVAPALEGNANAVLFERLGREGAQLVGNVMGSRARLARAFGVAPGQLLAEVLRRLRATPQVVEVPRESAPAQEIVLTGDKADLTALPVNLQHGMDGGPYVSASIDFAVDPSNGWTNVGVRRLMLRGRREAGVDLNSPSDLRALYEAATRQGQRLPVAFVVGSHPADYVAAVMRLPVDELGLLASLRGAPLAVMKCVSCDIRVPADAEWVLEGYLDERGHVEAEGPYGEFLGYYGGVKQNPVFHLSAVTRRRDALFQTATIGGDRKSTRLNSSHRCIS